MSSVADQASSTDVGDSLSDDFAHSLHEQRTRLRAAFAGHKQRIQQLEATLRRQVGELNDELQRERQTLDERQRELDQREDLTRQQRRAAAKQLRARRSELLAEIEQRRAEAAQLAAHEVKQLHRQLAEAEVQLEKLQAEIDQRERRCGELSEQLAAATDEARQLRDQLQQRQANAEKALDSAKPNAKTAVDSAVADVRQKLDLATEELRELKQANAELAKEVADAKSAAAKAPTASGSAFNWERQKQRLLEQLETDFDAKDPRQAKDKLTVEGTIRITDQLIAERDEEIAELKKLLECQSGNIGDVTVGASAIAEMIDRDEIVKQERSNLKLLQDEWREKLRAAEVDIAVERAKLARERAELEERIQSLEKGATAAKSESTKGSSGRRWLDHLGIKSDAE